MDARTNEKIRGWLLAQREALRREGDLEIEPIKDDPTKKVDEDAAPLTEMNQVIASSRNRERARKLHDIAEALARLEDDPDDFGRCESCDEAIPMRRLEVMPWASLCIGCQSEREADDGRGGSRKHLTDYR